MQCQREDYACEYLHIFSIITRDNFNNNVMANRKAGCKPFKDYWHEVKSIHNIALKNILVLIDNKK